MSSLLSSATVVAAALLVAVVVALLVAAFVVLVVAAAAVSAAVAIPAAALAVPAAAVAVPTAAAVGAVPTAAGCAMSFTHKVCGSELKWHPLAHFALIRPRCLPRLATGRGVPLIEATNCSSSSSSSSYRGALYFTAIPLLLLLHPLPNTLVLSGVKSTLTLNILVSFLGCTAGQIGEDAQGGKRQEARGKKPQVQPVKPNAVRTRATYSAR